MLYRVKYLLGIMVGLFSLVYILFGVAGWLQNTISSANLLMCFALASAHLGASSWLLLSSIRQFKIERTKLDLATRHLIRTRSGRVFPAELSLLADVSEEDAVEYLEKRCTYDVALMMQNRKGTNVFFFGQQFWNN
ncbi:MAG: hypothetical protein IAE64_01315 [Flavobacteriales bacterium]|nr:MAG: hypothetical protein UZ06_CHB003000675 [Chlorobi bacterium OLB6]MBE2264874.1 hypothetical protein [Flavobacteriales bacterium]MBV6463206.1 hypothetical protein [Chlorobiota bacterium]MBW7853101.1 hypothetical protein [Candidatus Kapabacteria bacterium]MCC6331410.1 hypothetical protein [Ignavibacteria bacterium]